MTAECLDRRALLASLGGLAAGTLLTQQARAGDLNPPPGPISPTGKTLQEIFNKIARTDAGIAEGRIPVQSLPGSANAVHIIAQPGSYYLTADLLGQNGKNGILITADDVRLDLCGYAVRGVPGALAGIDNDDFRAATSVRNGIVTGWPGDGVRLRALSRSCLVHDLHVYSCGGGIITDWQAFILNSVVDNAAGSGISVGEGSLVANCLVRFAGIGIAASFETSIVGNECSVCGVGIQAFFGNSRILDNHVARSSAFGVHVVGNIPGSHVERNTLTDNGGGGIVTEQPGSLVVQNRVRGSGGVGDYSFAAGTSYGPVVNVATVGDISVVPNADHPWANFIY